jgi:sugar lactone lactonase YvrE
MSIRPFLNYGGRLSEGPTYNPSNNTLLWVDIINGKFHRVTLPNTSADEYTSEEQQQVEESHEEFTIPGESIGVIYLTTDDDILYLGGKSGIAEYKFSTGSFKYKWYYPNGEKLRSNDGNVDPQGNIWQGVMGSFENGPIPEGCLLKIDTKSDEIKTVIPEVLISNGINWSQDGNSMFWTSSLDLTIYRFDYRDGEISNKQEFIKIKDFYPDVESPEPDGHTLTESGDLFTAVWSTGTIAQFNSKGELIKKFELPALRTSACSFGGVNMDELFVTTAHLNLEDPNKLDTNAVDFGGSIFRIKVKGQKGLLRPKLSI